MPEIDVTAPSVQVVQVPIPAEVLDFLGWPLDIVNDDESLELARVHLQAALTAAHSYTRGRGWSPDGTQVAGGIAVAVVTCAARTLSNPSGDRQQSVGGLNTQLGPAGWSLSERAALDLWRISVAA